MHIIAQKAVPHDPTTLTLETVFEPQKRLSEF